MIYLACASNVAGQVARQAMQPPLDQFRGKPTTRVGSIAQIHIAGTMSRGGSFLGGTSTDAVRDEIHAAVENPQVTGIVLAINSHGGLIHGSLELAREVRNAAAKKPIVAAIQDIGASAAYWVASQATRVFATEDSVVGSIGTMAVITDSSRAAEDAGYKVHVIRADVTSEHKALGQPGVPISASQLSDVKKRVEAFNDMMLRDVSLGRQLSGASLSRAADGRAFMPKEAKQLGLIDDIGSAQAAIDYIVGGRQKPKQTDAVTLWNKLIDCTMHVKKLTRPQAVVACMAQHRAEHQAYIAAVNGRSHIHEHLA